MDAADKAALVLTGGGARAGYQVGVLKAIRELLPDPRRNPFPIICGTSAGAINAASLAVAAENFGAGVEEMLEVWGNFRAEQVYRADAAGIALTAARWLSTLMVGWLTHRAPVSLLDNSPLRRLLAHKIDFASIDRAIERRTLHAVSITCSGYNSGQSISFFQGRPDLEPWQRVQRGGAHVKLQLEHLMASSAIPFIFPAVRLHREYFGDGSMRQIAPISPAIHLGADRVLVIGAGRMTRESDRPDVDSYPSLAQIAGHALSSIFLDSLSTDIERMMRINQTVSMIPPEIRSGNGIALRKIDVLVIAPSERLDDLATRHVQALPRPVRFLLGGIGATNRNGGALASYLLFEQAYTRALIDLGYRDTMSRQSEVRAFLACT